MALSSRRNFRPSTMAEYNDDDEFVLDDIIENNLDMFMEYVCDCLDAIHLLACLHFFTNEQRMDIFEMSSRRKHEATRMALGVIKESTETNKYRTFVEALDKIGYSKVAKMLTGRHTPHDTNCRKIVDIFTPELIQRIKPSELLQWLVSFNVVGEMEADHIRAEEQNHSQSRACWLMLHYLPCREKNWFKYFLKALMKCDQAHIAENLDPDLFEKLSLQMKDGEKNPNTMEEESLSLVYSMDFEPQLAEVNVEETVEEQSVNKLLQDPNSEQDQSFIENKKSLLDFSELVETVSKMKVSKEADITDKVDECPESAQTKEVVTSSDATVDTDETELMVLKTNVMFEETDIKGNVNDANVIEDFDELLEQPGDADTTKVKQIEECDAGTATGAGLQEEFEKLLLNEANRPKNITMVSVVLSGAGSRMEHQSELTVIEKDSVETTKEKRQDGTSYLEDFSELAIPPVANNEVLYTRKNDLDPESTQMKEIATDTEKTDIKVVETHVRNEEIGFNVVENWKELLEQPRTADTTKVGQLVESDVRNAPGVDLEEAFENLLLDDLKADRVTQNDLSKETNAVEFDEEEFNIATDTDSLPEVVDRDIELRNYQRELAREGCEGENVIIVAPTNSGKTRVSCAIMQAHMRRCKSDGRIGRVIFIVENEALAMQQGKACAEQLEAYRTKVISGSVQRDKHQYLKAFMDRRDILIVTAQVLVNSLREKEIQSVANFSMIVFDECHHTDSCHPYNQIMSKYMDLKFNKNFDQARLPQIVGLTASVGVGGNLNETKAMAHMKGIMANLDTSYLCTVRQNIEELKQYENPPVEETVKVRGREDDIFKITVHQCVGEINRKMAVSLGVLNLEDNDKKICRICEVPLPLLGSEKFIQWLSDFKKGLVYIKSEKARQILSPCWHHLEIYNKALMIHKDARVKEARALMHVCLKYHIEKKHLNEYGDMHLLDLYKRIQQIDYSKIPQNPKLIRLQQLILKVLGNNQDARGIIFVKTRELARALINWTKETPELASLNASEFVGQVATASEGGMTKCGQSNILEYFRDGRHKLIIATSVAEEGLDIGKCNLVIRYEHVTNEIVRLQSRGRARAELSKYYVLTEIGSWIAEKEAKNAQLEELMKKTVPIIQQETELNHQQWLRDMREIQKKAKDEERAKEKEREAKRTFGPCQLQCFNCSTLLCWSTDVKKIQNAHHVVTDDLIVDRIVTKRSLKPDFQSDDLIIDGKIFCGNCEYNLGSVCEYKTIQFPLLKIGKCRIELKNGEGYPYKKKWKDVPFYVEALTLDDQRQIAARRLQEKSN